VAINGWGDAAGYHLDLGRESSGFAWHEVALLRPAGLDESSWTGYQCVSGDGKFAAVAILPASAVNQQAARDHGAFAYSVDLASGTVRPLAGGVGLKYFSPGCGTGDDAVFSLNVGTNDQNTQLLDANLTTGKITSSTTVPGQITSAVPTANGVVGVAGSHLVAVPTKGAPTVLATVADDAYALRPSADGGVSFLQTTPGSRVATAMHEHTGTLDTLGSGPLTRVQLFQGRAGHAVLSGASKTTPGLLASANVLSVKDSGLVRGATGSSLDGHALLGPDANGQKTDPVVLVTRTGGVLTRSAAPSTAKPTTAMPSYTAAVVTPAPTTTQAGKPQPKAVRRMRHPRWRGSPRTRRRGPRRSPRPPRRHRRVRCLGWIRRSR
jgi:hypothetical protein